MHFQLHMTRLLNKLCRWTDEVKHHYTALHSKTPIKQVRPSSGTDVYPHMPILRPRDFTNGASLAWRLCRRISMAMFTCGWAWPARSPILGFWGSKVHKNAWFPALDAYEPPRKIVTHTHKKIYPHLAYRHVWIYIHANTRTVLQTT